MLLQLEIIIWITSGLLMILLPLVWLMRCIIRSVRNKREARLLEITSSSESNISNEVIPGLLDESSMLIDELLIDKDAVLANERDISSPEEVVDSESVIIDAQSPVEIVDKPDDQPEISDDVISQDRMIVEEAIEIIETDIDGDGIVDEVTVIQTATTISANAQDVTQVKRQKSLDMLQFELRSLKDK